MNVHQMMNEPGIDHLRRRFGGTRQLSLALVEGLSDADASAQSMPDASPAKWHLAHATWFFETFVLRDHVAGYRPFDERFHFLFNSYYEAEGARLARPNRGLLTRPSLEQIRAYRRHVDDRLIDAFDRLGPEARMLVELGCHHEQQHQELLLTDLKHLFAQNPLAPAVWPAGASAASAATSLGWIEGAEGAVQIGHDGAGFAFDCETPRHKVWLSPHSLADRPITNGEWRGFIQDGGYSTPSLWLSDGWSWVQQQRIFAPLYWSQDCASSFTLAGETAIIPAAPVCHISFYEADAFARWAGARLPTEMEWESAAMPLDSAEGNFLDMPNPAQPRPAEASGGLRQMFGDVWEWTNSAYLAYPGFRPAEGAVGEYNGKFMSGQFVLRGGSCATPRGHVRASYRNFFYPHQRWQFTGLRLAKDL